MSSETSQNHNWYERFLNLISVVKPGEGKSCVLLTLNAALLMAAYYLLKVIREPLILAYGGAEYKSYATALQAGTLMILIPFFSVMYHRFADSDIRSTIINRVLLFFISNLAIFAIIRFLNFNVGLAFYVWVGIFNVMVVAQFWAFAADSYNVRCGQRLFVILAVGATFGAWLGSKIAGPVLPIIGITGIMVLASAILLLTVFITKITDGTIPIFASNTDPLHQDEPSNQWLDGFSVVFKSKYLLLIALFVVILIFVNSTGEYILARLVTDHSQALLASGEIDNISSWQGQFYSSYYSWITLGSFLLQLLVVSRLFKWIGIRGTVMVLPIIMIIGYGMMLFFPIFSLIRLAMTLENSANYSVQNTTRHALFLPVPRKLKYLGKTTIETFFYRFGDLLYGIFIYFGTQYFDFGVSAFIISNLILAVLLLFIAWKVGHYNQMEVQKSQGNSPPELMATIPDVNMPVGTLSKFSISECTFVDPDVGDALKFHAHLETGEVLPKWVKFDRMTRTFSFTPPNDHTDSINIEIVATDFEGLSASSVMSVSFFKAN